MATTYPNGPVAVATEGRVNPEDQWFHPRAKITVRVQDASQSIGIFGHYDSLTLEFSETIEDRKHVWAQDLLATEATDILSLVDITNNKLILPGDLIDKIGTSAGDKGDLSSPGLVIQLGQ